MVGLIAKILLAGLDLFNLSQKNKRIWQKRILTAANKWKTESKTPSDLRQKFDEIDNMIEEDRKNASTSR